MTACAEAFSLEERSQLLSTSYHDVVHGVPSTLTVAELSVTRSAPGQQNGEQNRGVLQAGRF
jgi:hypothetical protein